MEFLTIIKVFGLAFVASAGCMTVSMILLYLRSRRLYARYRELPASLDPDHELVEFRTRRRGFLLWGGFFAAGLAASFFLFGLDLLGLRRPDWLTLGLAASGPPLCFLFAVALFSNWLARGWKVWECVVMASAVFSLGAFYLFSGLWVLILFTRV